MELTYASYILVLGATIVLVLLLRPTLERLGVPPLVGYFLLGFALRLADARWDLLGESGHQIFEFLGYVGIVVLLFRVGLESDLPGLLRRLYGPILEAMDVRETRISSRLEEARAKREDAEVGFGVELRIGERKVAWSLDSYLDALKSRVRERLDAELRKAPTEGATEAVGPPESTNEES